MNASTGSRTYEAFFTTKRAIGTGLGLWISADIIAKQGGSIHVRTKLETGTAFTIALPYEHTPAAQGFVLARHSES
jgi:signal transduction histidine kinase